ncbi:N-acetylmuramoyl-L-alanine amidase [Paraclostridium sordellii]|uniref:N-acetylmuramoyl-L-alanine amidase n=1 Tax=Paraclostridium sordellii TaxID=1505 RepID=UPI0005E5622C|nr:N-acetylmuramoyl-L-alanine amidase [Paeniclostridium sordellii]AUN13664.1 hypothetical protein RSJ16_05250 [Paeniclostridium sordellii]MBX9180346.1 SH3 domain-containing protein [Paeniclostridium sordellii]MDU2686301.1 N-acetylmuramoyl-L-alanine amidase [Paeniclostridium sordellii]MVO71680.1 SH3 domain-containing protein [Paeniclostridium sordellii]CEN87786.1 N-acetylmuramoyl-L-alanine amidase [[Clostridium] sordellii] [Paeniclostridium sordellii]
MKIKTIRKSIAAMIISSTFISGMTVAHADGYKVFIDAGHGGRDNGSSYGDRIEDKINLQIANKLEAKLKKSGIDVEVSRCNDSYVSLSERTKKSNLSDADMFISIHQNAADDITANGVETYYYNDVNKNLAKDIQKNLLTSTKGQDRGVRKGNLQVLRDNEKPAVLVECGFISGNQDGKKLNTSEYQDKIADGIVAGVKENLGLKTFGIGVKSNKNIAIALEDNVKVRSGRGYTFNQIGNLSKGQKVELIDTKFDWHKIKFDGKYGYVSSVYVK